MTAPPLPAHRGDYVAGAFEVPKEPDGEIARYDPGDLSVAVPPMPFAYATVDRAVEVARDAQIAWARRPMGERLAVLRAYQKIVERREDEIAAAITREMGKPLWEARQEVATMVAKVDHTIDRALALVETIEVPGGRCRFKARGVLAILGPFNFPGHLPAGHFVPALATGNAVVFKPSHSTPMVGQLLAEILDEAGAPAGVFNLVQGTGETGARLAAHPGVDGVLFTGSFEVGQSLRRMALTQPGKLLALEMGGKNAAVVLADADLDAAAREVALGAFHTSGQRCTATSRVVVAREIEDAFVERFVRVARGLRAGYGLDPDVFLGPLVTERACNHYLDAARVAEDEGYETLLPIARAEVGRRGHYVRPAVHRARAFDPRSRLWREELFAPHVVVARAEGFDEAMAMAGETDYGLAMSVFTRDDALWEEAWHRARVGVLNRNRSTVGASGALPFGGLGRSGNDRPTALFAPYYCTYPVASLEGATWDPEKAPPGYPREEP